MASTSRPVRVHWSDPDFEEAAADVLTALETAWAVQVDGLGWRAPTSDGDDLDVYLDDVGAFQAWVEPLTWDDAEPGDGYMSAPTTMVIDGDLPAEWIPSYVAHEFNHVLQFATDMTEPSLNFWEATATAAQAWTLGADSEWAYDVYAYQEAPWAPSLLGDSYVLWDDYGVGWTYEYGAALWVMHVDHAYGSGDGALATALWDAAANEGWDNDVDHLDALEAVTGDDLGAFLDRLAVSRWLTGARWREEGLPDAADWGADEAVPVAHALTADDLPATLTLDPMITGQVFVTVDTEGLGDGFVVARAGPPGSVVVFAVDDGLQVDSEAISTAVDEVVIAVSNPGPAGLSAEDDPYVRGEIVLTVTVESAGEDAGGCGCGTGAAGAGWWLAMVAMWGRRRR